MKKNNEVTLRIKGDLENFREKLIKKGYEEYDHFILDDIFMIPNNLKIEEMSTREIISKAVIIRKIELIDKREIKQDLVYKIKKFNNKGEILEQTSIRLKILDCEDAEKFMTERVRRQDSCRQEIGHRKGTERAERGSQGTKPGRHHQILRRTECRMAGCFAGHLQRRRRSGRCQRQPGRRSRRERFGRLLQRGRSARRGI